MPLSRGMLTAAAVLAHERLSIVGVDSGAQPLTNKDETIALAVNGEIYNHRLIRKGLKNTYHFKTHSDCEVIIPLVSHKIIFVGSKTTTDQVCCAVYGIWN